MQQMQPVTDPKKGLLFQIGIIRKIDPGSELSQSLFLFLVADLPQ